MQGEPRIARGTYRRLVATLEPQRHGAGLVGPPRESECSVLWVDYQLLLTQPPGLPPPVPTEHERVIVPEAIEMVNESPVGLAVEATE